MRGSLPSAVSGQQREAEDNSAGDKQQQQRQQQKKKKKKQNQNQKQVLCLPTRRVRVQANT